MTPPHRNLATSAVDRESPGIHAAESEPCHAGASPNDAMIAHAAPTAPPPRRSAEGGTNLPRAGRGPKDDAARANATSGRRRPAARDGGDAASVGMAGELRGAAGPARRTTGRGTE